MSWPLPQPAALALQYSTFLGGEVGRIYLAKTGKLATPDTTSPNSVLSVAGRKAAMAAFDLYLMQRRIADEMMPDTSQDWLYRHAAIWRVPQDQPLPATGNAQATAQASIATPLVIPSGITATAPGGALYATTSAVSIAAGATVGIPVQAAVPGTAGDLAAGTVLTLVNPIAGLTQQVLVVDSNGVTNGQDLESTDSWRSRILARIRKRGSGGSVADYKQWMQEVLPGSLVGVSAPSAGYVTVAFAMPVMVSGAQTGWRAPTTAEIAAATAYVTNPELRKPLTAQVSVIAATLLPVNVTLHMIPDTVAIRAAVQTALQLYFLADGTIGTVNQVSTTVSGGGIEMSRLDNAISSGSGEFAHDRSLPTADLAGAVNTLPVLGAVNFI